MFVNIIHTMSKDTVQAQTPSSKGDAVKKTAFPTFSKAKYNKLMELLERVVPEHKDEINRGICEIFNYDPSLPRSTPERSAYTVAYVKNKAQKLGTTTYVAGSRQKAYMREKEQRKAEATAITIASWHGWVLMVW